MTNTPKRSPPPLRGDGTSETGQELGKFSGKSYSQNIVPASPKHNNPLSAWTRACDGMTAKLWAGTATGCPKGALASDSFRLGMARIETRDGPLFRLAGEKSPDAFNAFIASDAFKKVTNWGKQNILSGRPQHTTYQHD